MTKAKQVESFLTHLIASICKENFSAIWKIQLFSGLTFFVYSIINWNYIINKNYMQGK